MRSEEVECEQCSPKITAAINEKVLGAVEKAAFSWIISAHRIHCQVVAGEGNSTLIHMATSLSHYCSSLNCPMSTGTPHQPTC